MRPQHPHIHTQLHRPIPRHPTNIRQTRNPHLMPMPPHRHRQINHQHLSTTRTKTIDHMNNAHRWLPL